MRHFGFSLHVVESVGFVGRQMTSKLNVSHSIRHLLDDAWRTSSTNSSFGTLKWIVALDFAR